MHEAIKLEEIESLIHVNAMADESLPPDLLGNWCEIVAFLAKARGLDKEGGAE